MEVVQKDHWYIVVLVFLPFLKVAVLQNVAAPVRLEEGMVLECLCPWDGNLSMVSWTKVPDRHPIAVFHPDFGVNFSHRYRERIEFLRNTPMDASISVRNVTHQDIGLYHCSVQTFPQGPWTRNVQVEDLDEPPEEEDATPPPTPEVIRVDAELVARQRDNLTLGCEHKHNGSVYQVNVERRGRGQRWSIIGVCKTVDGGLVSEDYSDSERGRIGCGDGLDVSLQLTGVEPEDGGFYRCTFSTDAGVRTTTVLLTVTLPGYFSLSKYMMYIYIGAGAAGLILLFAILLVAVKQRKRNRREEYRVRHPFQRQPNIYENIPPCPRNPKKSKQIRNCPVYVNQQTVQSLKNQRRPPYK